MAQSSSTLDHALSPFRVDPADELPVGVQLEWRLRSLIATGRLAPGDRLPSVRSLADWAGVNVNTVRSVYAGLENKGLVATQHGSGTFVVASGFSPELEQIAISAIAEARELGASARELAMIALVCGELDPDAPAALPQEPGADERPARDELRRQIGRLEAQLASHATETHTPAQGASREMGRVISTAQLEQARDELLSRLDAARKAESALGAKQNRARQIREEMVADPGSRRWQKVSDAEMGEEGCRDYTVGAGPLGSLMSWWRLKVSGGCPLAGSA